MLRAYCPDIYTVYVCIWYDIGGWMGINSTVVFLLILIWTENLHVLHIHQRPCSPYYLNAYLEHTAQLGLIWNWNIWIECKIWVSSITETIRKNSQPTAAQISKDRTYIFGRLSHIIWGQLHYKFSPYFQVLLQSMKGYCPNK